MNFEPHDYQAYAIDYIKTHPVAAVLLDMGLGKTVISLTAIAADFIHFRRRRRGQVRSAYECTNNYHWPDHSGRVCGHCGKGHLQPPPWQELLLLRGLLRRRVRPLRLVRAVPP